MIEWGEPRISKGEAKIAFLFLMCRRYAALTSLPTAEFSRRFFAAKVRSVVGLNECVID